MEFSNIITLSDVISIVLGIFTIVTIGLTYLTLNEMKEQRIVSTKPNLVLTIKQSIKYDDLNNLDYFYDGNKELSFKLENTGQGVARNIEICVNYKSLLNGEIYSVEKSDSRHILDVDYENIVAVIPEDNMKFYQTIQTNNYEKFSFYFLNSLIYASAINLSKVYSNQVITDNKNNAFDRSKLRFTIKIKYFDISNEKYMAEFNFFAYPNMISAKVVGYSFEIENFK